MINPLQWVWASAQTGATLVGASPVPIRSLHAGHRDAVLAHLLTLEVSDRYLRFGYAASDAQIGRYVASLDFNRDRFFGVFGPDLRLLAMAHLAFMGGAGDTERTQAEFGVSVEASTRGQGMGRALFTRTVMYARNLAIRDLYVFVLRENTAMVRIVESAQAEITGDHSELDCWVRLAPSTVETRFAEFWEEQRAQIDYQLKMASPQRQKDAIPDDSAAPPTLPH
jgi:RimJ/RimL family protein N-acetyltransferase